MKPMVIKSSAVKQEYMDVLKIKELTSIDESPDIGIALIELSGMNAKIINSVSDMFYFILEGEGLFTIADKDYKVTRGDLVIIPKGTFYSDLGDMKMLSFSNPRFNTDNVEHSK